MKNKLHALAWLVLSCLFGRELSAQNATNPLIFSDVPDVDILRVGDTYYMSSTTMYFNPGVPIMKSKDLVNWQLVNYCYPIMANTDEFNLANGKEAYSGGSWASSISFNKGIYYVTTFSYTTGKTYIYKTSDIEKGPWTTITLNKVYHDHSLFFDDDGKVYLAYGHDDIQLTEMKPDLTGEQPGGVNKIIVPKASSVAGSSFILTAEGTHLQKINGTYYVSNICWPNGKGRTQTIWKSSTLTGSYTGKVAFSSINGAAQGEYVDTPDGKWYALFFQDNGSVGRIPDLMPVTWSGGWPTVGVNGQVPATIDIPRGSGSIRGIVDSDEFTAAPPLKLQWQWNHNPQNNYWSLTQKTGFLRLTNERTDANVLRTTNTLTQRTFGPKCSGYVAVDVSGMKDGDYAGLLSLQNKYGFVGVKMSGSTKSIVQVNGTGFSGTPTEIAGASLNQNTVYFRIDFDFTNRTDKAYFYYSLNGTTWTAIGSTLSMTFDLEHFTGYRFGLFSYATKSSGGYADFDFFRVGATITEAINSANNSSAVNVSLTSPNLTFTAPATVDLTANATISGGTISKVEFYNGTTKLGEDASAPYTYSWANVTAGSYSLTAVVTDNTGKKTTSSALSIKVNAPQGPYNGKVHPIPGVIQIEDYDVGGNGVAYSDNTPGSEVTPVVNFRADEDVDLEVCTDAGGGYNLGYAIAGEWLEYTTNVTSAGLYNLDLRVAANGEGRSLLLSMEGSSIGTVNIPNTTGWQTWTTVNLKDIPLKAGQQILRLTVGPTDYVNVNYLEFKSTLTTGITEEAAFQVAMYPNPFTEEGLKVMTEEATNYQIFDIMGQERESGKLNQTAPIGKSLAKGTYLLRLSSNTSTRTVKITRQ